LEGVKDSLQALGVQGMTISEVKGMGVRRGTPKSIVEVNTRFEFVPKVKIEVVVDDEVLEGVVDAIVKASRTGKFGDGKIFVIPVEEAIRIRTGEHGLNAV
jgi:nitrogen regulatory protein P-II 1